MKSSAIPCLVLLVASCNQVTAAELGLGISTGYESQHFANDSGSLAMLRATPMLSTDVWYFSVDIPWEKVDNAFTPSRGVIVNRICDAISGGQPLPPRLRRFQTQLTSYCSQPQTADVTDSGVGDVSISASYGWSFDSAAIWNGVASASYIADNGNSDTGLGTGTHDVSVDLLISGDFEHASTSFNTGYNHVLGGDFEQYYEDSSYLSIEFSTPNRKQWVFGANWLYQQENVIDTKDLNQITLFSDWNYSDDTTLRIYYVDYSDNDYYPESAAGIDLTFNF